MVHADHGDPNKGSPCSHGSCPYNNPHVCSEGVQGTFGQAESTVQGHTSLPSNEKTDGIQTPQTLFKNHAQSNTVCVTRTCADITDEDTVRSLDDALHDSMILSAGGNGTLFLPKDKLQSLVTLETVRQELDRYTPSSTNPETAGLICARKSPRRKIFAILCMMSKIPEIHSFIRENISDVDLPLLFNIYPNKEVFLRHNRDPRNKPQASLALFQAASWRNIDRDSFKLLQWQFLLPYFSLKYHRKQKSRHWKLESSQILPFVEDTLNTNMEIELANELREGGFSIVRKIRIHPAHHNRTSNEGSSFFAVKELKRRPDQGLKEIQALLRFNEQPHNHLIRLLATYEHRNRLNMIFPWAEGGDLENFWKTNSSPPRQNHKYAIWISKQFLGLASALRIIHHPNDVKGLICHDNKTHGRHGDIKPTNILWFRSHDSEGSLGTLKISDFGFADFHAERSKSRVPGGNIQGLTDIYRAPELEVDDFVSPRYDIWSFGCVLLEFAVWYLLGHEGISRFTEARLRDSSARIKEDNFFNFDRGKDSTAHTKRSVGKMFRELKKHKFCTEHISDILDLIQKDLLRSNPKNRARCTVIENSLRLLDQRCVQEVAYCMAHESSDPRRAIPNGFKSVGSPLSPDTTKTNSDSASSLPSSTGASGGILIVVLLAIVLYQGCNTYLWCSIWLQTKKTCFYSR